MKEIRKQLMNREIIICVFGRHNCGKSTLLNAMLANRYMHTLSLCLHFNQVNIMKFRAGRTIIDLCDQYRLESLADIVQASPSPPHYVGL